MIVLAHGLGGRSDLPIPLWLALYGGAAALLISFFALVAFWKTPRLSRDARLVLPRIFGRAAKSRWVRVGVRTVGAVFWIAMIVVAFFGPDNSSTNPAPYWFYIWFWVGLVPASLLLGPVWRELNPLRALSALVLRFINQGELEMEQRQWPAGLGYWPAVAGLFAFVWLELVYIDPSRPVVLGTFLVIYSVAQVIGAMTFGMGWFERGDGFEVYSTVIGRLSPFDVLDDGRIGLRNPLRNLAELTDETPLVPVIAVILGSTAFDGITRTQIWSDWTSLTSGLSYVLLGTAGLLGAIGLVALTYMVAIRTSARFAPLGRARRIAGVFVHSLIPIAVGYTVAHYFTLFLFEGQGGYILASDPFSRGWNLFGTAHIAVNFKLISPQTVALVQTGAIVLGHIVGVVAAHDRAMEVFPDDSKTKAQYSLLAAMVLYTVSGIALLVGA